MKRKYHLNFFLRQPVSLRDTSHHIPNDLRFLRVSRVTSPSQVSSQLFTSPSQVPSLYLCDLSATRVQVTDSSFHLWKFTPFFNPPKPKQSQLSSHFDVGVNNQHSLHPQYHD